MSVDFLYSRIDHTGAPGTLSAHWIRQELFLCEFADGKLFERRGIDGGMTLVGNNSYTRTRREASSFDSRCKTRNTISYNDHICVLYCMLPVYTTNYFESK